MSNICKNWTDWLNKTRFSYMTEIQRAQTLNWLISVKDTLIENANIKAGDKIIDIGCGTGLMGFGVLENFQDSVEIIMSDKFEDCLIECENFLKTLNTPNKITFLQSDCADIKLPSEYIDKAFMRSVLVHIVDKQSAVNDIYRILKKGGSFIAFEPIIASNTRYWELVEPNLIEDYEEFKRAENDFMSNPNNSLVNFDQNSLAQNLETAGFNDGTLDVNTVESNYLVDENTIIKWFEGKPSPDQMSVKERFLTYFDEEKVNKYIAQYVKALEGQEVSIKTNTLFIKAIK